MNTPTPEGPQSLLHEDLVLLDVEGRDLGEVSQSIAGHLVKRGTVPEDKVDEVVEAIVSHEQKASTAVGHGAVCPHAYADYFGGPALVCARLRKPLDLVAPDGEPIDLVFLLVGRKGDQEAHLDTLVQVARLIQNDRFCSRLREATTPRQVVDAATEAAQPRTEELGPAALARAGLQERTGRFAGGIRDDIARRLPFYGDDFKQGLNLKCVAATIFLFFACFTAAVTFGALMDEETSGAIGAIDMLMATAFCGVIYALVAGQPLVILGGTGPLLVFTALLFQLTGRFESIDFLPFYAWVGLWAAAFTILLAVTDASVWIRYFTRFTDEIFVLLIAAIFIVEAISLTAHEFKEDERLISYSTAISAVLLVAGTFGIAIALRTIRNSRLLRRWARNFLADFGVVIAIGSMCVVAYLMRGTTELPHITVPTNVSLDLSEMLVPIGDLPIWAILGAAVPGLFAAILIFIDQQITARVVNAPQFQLSKGPGYHLDLFLVGVLVAVCSVLGWPWLVAATVRSLNHVAALSATHAEERPGGAQVVTDRVLENRVTGLFIHILIGLSVLLAPILKMVPMACLHGVFLYMGIASLGGNQLFERITLWVTDPEMLPRDHYLRTVPRKAVHGFTTIQVGCLAVLWVVKVSAIAILFPLVLAMLVPVRMVLTRVFDERNLELLDAEETPEEEGGREAAP